MIDFSIDLETLGNKPYSVILDIGIVAFHRDTDTVDEGTNILVNAQDCVAHGLRMNADTVLWWMNQSDAARSVFAPI